MYMAKKGEKWSIFIDGKESRPYDGVATPFFSPDSRHYAYVAQDKGAWFAVVDGVESKERFLGFLKDSDLVFDKENAVNVLGIQLSPDSKLGPNLSRLRIELPD